MFIVAYITLKCDNLTIANGENTSFFLFGKRLLEPSRIASKYKLG
jgi:hypothetical protein